MYMREHLPFVIKKGNEAPTADGGGLGLQKTEAAVCPEVGDLVSRKGAWALPAFLFVTKK